MKTPLDGRRIALIATGATLCLLVVVLGTLGLVQRGRVLPNTSILGTDVGRLTPDEVRATIAPIVADQLGREIVFASTGETFTLDPRTVTYTVDVEASIEAAMDRGRRGSFLAPLQRITSLRWGVDLDLVDTWDPVAVGRWTAGIAREADRGESIGALDVDPTTLEVAVVAPTGARTVDTTRLITAVERELRRRSDGPVELPAETTEPPVPREAVESAAERLTSALRAPIVLTSQGARLAVTPDELAATVGLAELGTTLGGVTLTFDPIVLDRLVGARARQAFDVDPIDARYVVPRRPPVTFDQKGSATFRPVEFTVELQPGRDGTRFDPGLFAEGLARVVTEGRTEAPMPLIVDPAGITDEIAAQGRPTHLLGTFTTYFTAGQTRNLNIRTLADTLDGTVVLPGERFSINGISGPRSCDKGYVLAGTIVAGELVDTCGGGTSQIGTTTFNAAFFAGLQLDQWKAHSWYLSRYPMGREATLTYPSLDVVFTNDTEGNLLVTTSTTDDSVTVSIYGRPRFASVRAELGPTSSPRPFSVRTRPAPDLLPGEERVVQAGADGFSVEVVRTLTAADGLSTSQRFRTVYSPQVRIIEVGVDALPPPPE